MTEYLQQSDRAMHAFCTDAAMQDVLAEMAGRVAALVAAGGKLLACGNGGSAADAQHIAGEFTSRLMYDRPPMAAVALTTDSSAITAIGNDYGYAQVFARQVRALGRPGDALLAISTSGRSENVLLAMDAARTGGMLVLAFAGQDPGPMAPRADLLLAAPSALTPIVQQTHITAAHVLCALVERRLHPRT
jgi:D-sedoheptulose 7-phosphate isomerase